MPEMLLRPPFPKCFYDRYARNAITTALSEMLLRPLCSKCYYERYALHSGRSDVVSSLSHFLRCLPVLVIGGGGFTVQAAV